MSEEVKEVEETEQTTEEIVEEDQTQDDELESEEEANIIEEWQREDGEEDYQVDGHLHQSMKQKYKTRISKRDDKLERLESENEALRLAAGKKETALKRPVLDDFESDEEYEFARSKYDSDLAQETYNRNQVSERQRIEVEEAKKITDEAVEGHYSRVDALIKETGIKEENYKKADESFRMLFSDIVPDGGDIIADNIIARLGKGSEKVTYYLGVNKAAKAKAKDLLKKDKTGLALAMYLGQEKQRLTKPKQPRSNAPDPAKSISGDEVITGSASKLKKAYDKAGPGNTESYNIKQQAKKAGVDTSKW